MFRIRSLSGETHILELFSILTNSWLAVLPPGGCLGDNSLSNLTCPITFTPINHFKESAY